MMCGKIMQNFILAYIRYHCDWKWEVKNTKMGLMYFLFYLDEYPYLVIDSSYVCTNEFVWRDLQLYLVVCSLWFVQGQIY